ncbi:MAG TPA: DUF6510 family protein [Streptosporangiaceae bacterium]|nr:DUF6510 family protein [Streptosporangiaceae bacterium]
MVHLDGNMLGGTLGELFAVDFTAAMGQCAWCGDRSVIAAAMVYPDGPGLVARCSVCGQVIFRVVRGPDRAWLDLRGMSYLELAMPA